MENERQKKYKKIRALKLPAKRPHMAHLFIAVIFSKLLEKLPLDKEKLSKI